MSQSAYEKLVSYWTDGGLKIARGCRESEVRQFEIENGVALPGDLRAYFLHVNGMLPDAREDCDLNGFCFWPLSRVKSVVKELALHSSPMGGSAEDHLHFVFADYLQWSWAYAIRLTESAAGHNPVIHVGTQEQRTVANSFTQFAELYLRDSKDLYLV
jgi:hypothetical protein